MHTFVRTFCFLLSTLLLVGCTASRTSQNTPSELPPPSSVPREFRAAWVASVANINWPSRTNLSVRDQQQEARQWLDLLARNHFNAVVLQVRPQADALYDSPLEPWSTFLTGQTGAPPDPYYDPLSYWIEEAHVRGLELHAWINPFRAHHTAAPPVHPQSIVRQHPDWVVPLASGYWWMKPTHPQARAHTLSVVMDLVRRYDLDGIHLDDYFYPYPDYNDGADFPDQDDYQQYVSEGGSLPKSEWRRAAIDTLIQQMYLRIKQHKPFVKLGISPFGIWRPGHPPSIQGFDAYTNLSADARKWLQNGWIDYCSPQLYWPINQIPQSFPVLLRWWQQQNAQDRHLWPGLQIGRLPGPTGLNETLNQIMVTRGMIPEAPGQIHYNIGTLRDRPQLADTLRRSPYQQPALVPASPWLDHHPPSAPLAEALVQGDSLLISWQPTGEESAFRWIIQYQYGSAKKYRLAAPQDRFIRIPLFALRPSFSPSNQPSVWPPAGEILQPLTEVTIRAVDRSGLESPPRHIDLPTFTYDQAGPLKTFFLPSVPRPIEGFKVGRWVLERQQAKTLKGKSWMLVSNQPDLPRTAGSFLGVLDFGQSGLWLDDRSRPERDPSFLPEGQRPDLVVLDIQLDGTAWDSDLSTLHRALRWCAQNRVSLLITDRPNPLGGQVVEGPMIPRPENVGGDLPLRHGMTTAELASYWNDQLPKKAALQTLPLLNWTRDMIWPKTEQIWNSGRSDLPNWSSVVGQPAMRLIEQAGIGNGARLLRPYQVLAFPSSISDEQRLYFQRILRERMTENIPFYWQRMHLPGSREQQWVLNISEWFTTDRQVPRLAVVLAALYQCFPDQFDWFSPGIYPVPGTPGLTPQQLASAWDEQTTLFRKQWGYHLQYTDQDSSN